MANLKLVITESFPDLIRNYNRDFSPEEWAEFERKTHEIEKAIQRENRLKGERRGITSLNEKDWQVGFESLEITPENKQQIDRLQKWEPSMKKGIVLWGPIGTGKSIACKAIINRFATKDFRCLFISVPDAMQRLKDSIDGKQTNVGHEQEKLISPNLLVLDDLGAEKSTEWVVERIFTIFEKRAALDKFTFFTTNLDPKQIGEVYGPRIHDRMVQFCSWVKFEGKSFRKENFENEI